MTRPCSNVALGLKDLATKRFLSAIIKLLRGEDDRNRSGGSIPIPHYSLARVARFTVAAEIQAGFLFFLADSQSDNLVDEEESDDGYEPTPNDRY